MKTSMVYLLHFHEPIAPGKHTCQHYLGSADDLDVRLWQHRHKPDVRLMQVAKERRIGFDVVRVWPGEPGEVRKLERKLKQRKAGPCLCPICMNVRKERRWQLSFLNEMLLSFSLDDVPELEF